MSAFDSLLDLQKAITKLSLYDLCWLHYLLENGVKYEQEHALGSEPALELAKKLGLNVTTANEV